MANFLAVLMLPTALAAQEQVNLGKRLTASEIAPVVAAGRLDGFSYKTNSTFQVALNANGTAVFTASGQQDTAAAWAVENNNLCFLYEGTTSWSCRIVYENEDRTGIVLVEERDGGLIALSRLIDPQRAQPAPQPAAPAALNRQIAGEACAYENGQLMTRADISDYLNDKSYEGITWGKSGQVYSTQQNLARVDERRAVLRLQALGRGFEGDAFINNETNQLCQFMRKPETTLMKCFDAVRLAPECPFDVALLAADTGQLVAAYLPPIPISDAPPITVYESREAIISPPANAAEWFVAGIALAVAWDAAFGDRTPPVSRSELFAMPQSSCEQTIANQMLYCSEQAEYGSFSTTYYMDCNGTRRENQRCRGVVAYQSQVGAGDPFYCEPESKVRGPTPQSVFSQLCQ